MTHFWTQKVKETSLVALKYRSSPKLRITKEISRFYKSDFDISPIETKIRKFRNLSANHIQPQKQTFNTILKSHKEN